MKNKYCFLVVSFLCLNAYSQSEKKDFFEANIHLVGAGISYEKSFSEKFALRSSLEYDGSLSFRKNFHTTGSTITFVMQPTVKIQPRYYYNINKRMQSGKSIRFNAANFISVDIAYKSSELNISNKDYYMLETLAFGTAWNLRRNISNSNFIYEASAGIRYDYFFEEFYNKNNGITPELRAKIGYVFP